MYGEEQSKEILKISIVEHVEDKLIWKGHSSGNAIAAQVYKMLISQLDGQSNPQDSTNFPWYKFWKFKAP